MAANETKMNDHLLRAGFELTQIKHRGQIENIEAMEINLAVNQTQDKIM
jgi:N-acyl-L-homoserine lactone synthetase